MKEVLDLHTKEPKANRPVGSVDESLMQLIGELHRAIHALPGQVERHNRKYGRNGVANMFVMVDAQRTWRQIKVTYHRTGHAFPVCMCDLADIRYSRAQKISVVPENLSTHSAAPLYNSFPLPEA